MPFPESVIKSLKAIFAQAGRQLTNTEYLGNKLAERVIGTATVVVDGAVINLSLFLVGHASNDREEKHQIVTDQYGQHYLVDKSNNLHKL
jgi:hypothetical protein